MPVVVQQSEHVLHMEKVMEILDVEFSHILVVDILKVNIGPGNGLVPSGNKP